MPPLELILGHGNDFLLLFLASFVLVVIITLCAVFN